MKHRIASKFLSTVLGVSLAVSSVGCLGSITVRGNWGQNWFGGPGATLSQAATTQLVTAGLIANADANVTVNPGNMAAVNTSLTSHVPVTSVTMHGPVFESALTVNQGSLTLVGVDGFSNRTISNADLTVVPQRDDQGNTQWLIASGTVTLSGGTTMAVSGGNIEIHRDASEQWVIVAGSLGVSADAIVPNNNGSTTAVAMVTGIESGVQTTTQTSVSASTRLEVTTSTVGVRRVRVGTARNVISGGNIVVVGAPAGETLTVVDGEIRLGVTTSTTTTHWNIASGTLLVANGSGHRWRLQVDGGECTVAGTSRRDSSGARIWTSVQGELRVTASVSGDATLTLTNHPRGAVDIGAVELVPATNGTVASVDVQVDAPVTNAVTNTTVNSAVTSTVTSTVTPAQAIANLHASVTFGHGNVSVGRIQVGTTGQVLATGNIQVDGVPMVDGVSVIDGELSLQGSADTAVVVNGSTTRYTVGGGTLLLGDRQGRRWRMRVGPGAVITARATNTRDRQGFSVMVPAAGELHIGLMAQGDATLALADSGAGAVAVTGPNAQVAVHVDPFAGQAGQPLGTVQLGAMQELLGYFPANSNDALRMRGAVALVTHRGGGTAPYFYSIPVNTQSVVFLIDVSYSMRELDPYGVDYAIDPTHLPNKLDVARAELAKVLASLPSGVAVNIVASSSTQIAMWDHPRVLDPGLLHQAIQWVAALRPLDETHLNEGIQLVGSMQPNQVVILSDGRPTYQSANDRTLFSLVASFRTRGMRFDIAGVGGDQDALFLDGLASAGGGMARH